MNYQTLKMDEAKSQAQALGLTAIGDARKRLSWIAALESNDSSIAPIVNSPEAETPPELEVEPEWEPVLKPTAAATLQPHEERQVIPKKQSLEVMTPGLIALTLCELAIALMLILVSITSKGTRLGYSLLKEGLTRLKIYNGEQRDRVRPEDFLKFQPE